MKKIMCLFQLGTLFVSAQESSSFDNKKNEFRVDVLSAIAYGKLSISYERFIGKDFSIGVNTNFSNSQKIEDDFNDGFRNNLPKYEINPYASTPNIDLNLCKFVTGGFYNATAKFNVANDRYEFLCGIKLPSSGQYRLSFGYNSSSTSQVEIRSNSSSESISLTIFSKVSNLDGEGYYNLTVN